MQKPDLKAVIREEYKKCIEDPIYFMKKYVKIQHPTRGTCSFNLFPFQEETLQALVKNDFNIILKSRQMGISTLVGAYSLWLMTFFTDKNILCISISQETSKEIVTRVRFANDNLPSWLKVKSSEDNRLSLRLENGSQIKAVSSAGTAGRSAAVSLLVVDEAAFIDNIDEIWLSAQYTLSTGGRSVVLSCVTGDTYVYTDKGLKQVKDFVPSEKIGDYKIDSYNVHGVEKLRTSNLFKVNGKTDTIKIDTKFSSLEGSKIHKLWGFNSDAKKFDWIEMQNLTNDDYVSMQIGMDVWGNNDEIDTFNPSISNKIKNPIDIKNITSEWAYLFGLYISEGSSYKVLNKNSELIGGSITITCGDPEITWVFDKLNLSYSCHDGLHYTISSKNLIELFEHLGFDLSNHAHKKHIPPRLLELSKENIKWLLIGIFDGDGTASKGNVSLTSSSFTLIEQVRYLLINFGIPSSYGFKSAEKMNQYGSVKNKFNHDTHYIDIYGKYARDYFNRVGFSLKRKQDKFELLISKKLERNSSHNVIPNTLDLVNKLHDLSGHTVYKLNKLHGLNINGILNKKNRYKTDHISREIVLLLYNTYGCLLSPEEQEYWDKVIHDNIIWVKIKKITHNQSDVYDFSLPNNVDDFWCHSVIYNGIIGHQTPNGVGNWFHKTWVDSEAGENEFHTIRLPWYLHPERDQDWRDKQTLLSGVKGAAQECDCLGGESTVYVHTNNTAYEISLKELFDKMTLIGIPDQFGTDHNNFFRRNLGGNVYYPTTDTNEERQPFTILTPNGFKEFSAMRKLTKDEYLEIHLSNEKTINCSLNHRFIQENKEIFATDLKIGQQIDSINNENVYITDITYYKKSIDLYDIIEVDGGNLFIADGIVSHNCDFSTSGNQVVEYSLLEFQKETYVIDPIEKRGPDGELWIWERADYSKNYIVSADCARGDGSDYSACHVIDVENAEQVAEYRGRLGTKDYGNFLVSLATEYNNALLVVENNNIGWATLQQIIDRNYDNLFYTDMDLKVVDPDKNFTNKLNSRDKKSVPGFTTTQRNRPLMISKLEAYFVDKSITIHSIRTYDELCVFIWNGAKAEAMWGYNDDLVMSLSIGLWIRDTALKLRLDQMAYNKSMIEGITRIAENKKPVLFSENMPYAYDANKTWKFTAEGKKEDLTWLL